MIQQSINHIEVIDFQSHEVDCFLCGKPTEHRWGVPVYNGYVVSNDFPDDLWGNDGGGQAVCELCYDKHARGEIETFDRFYVPKGRTFIYGDGI